MESERYKLYINNGFKECDYAVYLWDLYEGKRYLVKDFRIIVGMSAEHGRIDKFPIFSYINEDYLIFNETYMDDWEYEDTYKYVLEKKLDKTNFDLEALYYIRLRNLIDSIKSGEENIPFEIIKRKELDG